MNNKSKDISWMIGLILIFFIIRSEIISTFAMEETPEALSSRSGLLAIFLYSSIALAGLLSIYTRFRAEKLYHAMAGSHRWMWIRWLVPAGLLAVITWVYLYSPWQFVLAGPWTQLIVAVGFSQLTMLLLAQRPNMKLGWGEVVLVVSIFLFPGIVNDIRLLTDSSLASRIMLLFGFTFIIVWMVVLNHPVGERLSSSLFHLRDRLGRARWVVIVPFWLAPIIYHYWVGAETTGLYANMRFAILFLSLCITSYLFCDKKDLLVSSDSLLVSLGMLVLASAVDEYLQLVVNYPFGLYWSEGNRFFDYSLVFGQSLYNYSGTITNPYGYAGRFGLWGMLFLVDGLPIWVHRLWNLILQIVPPWIFAFLITRKIQPDGLRYQIAIWIALFFIVLAPLHPPFIIASIIIAWFAFDESPVKRGLSVLLAGYYVAISRFTWAFGPAAMGALIDLFLYYPRRTGNWFRRLLPAVVMALLGMVPGLYLNFAFFQNTLQGETLTGQQPLLWYRLLPNSTLGPGVLFLTLLYTSPLVIFIAWWMVTKQWKLDAWQKLAAWGALSVFFIAGLVISTKIGGGGDLHNLDMYLVTLMIVAVLGFMEVSKNIDAKPLPAWAAGLVVLMILFPVYNYTPLNPSASGHVEYADTATTQHALSRVRKEVEAAAQNGEVLFMDQRQLLTFGYMPAIPFVPEYEKKYMMDQAMANNATYFEHYYQDLAGKRFTLIVTEVLRSKLKSDMGGPFSEENDAFVTWVSNPTLCFYKPIFTSKETGVMLLVPRTNTTKCEEYLK